ncbi:hypothetical protein BESB_057560 [Besnoitia besnoiti]|uniref:C2HC/C3H-type domain-containing protein n=1 Tax=Besnoitia besnoiti TaxID=94643 RepID=A0A2A9MDN1_BESBE|nr:hypothetical protein BESB_057560 [Besnoitia besnoiti]PFH36105.1 hypothetical protein BESB_057560 [Besnoitia besnoiti]
MTHTIGRRRAGSNTRLTFTYAGNAGERAPSASIQPSSPRSERNVSAEKGIALESDAAGATGQKPVVDDCETAASVSPRVSSCDTNCGDFASEDAITIANGVLSGRASFFRRSPDLLAGDRERSAVSFSRPESSTRLNEFTEQELVQAGKLLRLLKMRMQRTEKPSRSENAGSTDSVFTCRESEKTKKRDADEPGEQVPAAGGCQCCSERQRTRRSNEASSVNEREASHRHEDESVTTDAGAPRAVQHRLGEGVPACFELRVPITDEEAEREARDKMPWIDDARDDLQSDAPATRRDRSASSRAARRASCVRSCTPLKALSCAGEFPSSAAEALPFNEGQRDALLPSSSLERGRDTPPALPPPQEASAAPPVEPRVGISPSASHEPPRMAAGLRASSWGGKGAEAVADSLAFCGRSFECASDAGWARRPGRAATSAEAGSIDSSFLCGFPTGEARREGSLDCGAAPRTARSEGEKPDTRKGPRAGSGRSAEGGRPLAAKQTGTFSTKLKPSQAAQAAQERLGKESSTRTREATPKKAAEQEAGEASAARRPLARGSREKSAKGQTAVSLSTKSTFDRPPSSILNDHLSDTSGSNWKDEDAEDERLEADLVRECPDCGRTFASISFEKHVKICQKVFMTKRKEYNMAMKRLASVAKETGVSVAAAHRHVHANKRANNFELLCAWLDSLIPRSLLRRRLRSPSTANSRQRINVATAAAPSGEKKL